MRSWQAAEAKQHFGRMVEAARSEPQALMRHAEPVGVIMSMDHYRALKSQADAEFGKFLLSSPMEPHDFDDGIGAHLSDDA